MQLISGVHHAGQVLDLFTKGDWEWGAADVGRRLAMSRAHAHRLLSTLAEIGLLDRVESSGRFRLSWTWFHYGGVIRATDPLIASSVPILRQIRARYGLETMLAVWRGGAMHGFSPDATQTAVHRQRSVCIALSVVLIAGLAEDELATHLASDPNAAWFPPPAELNEMIREVREGGLLARPEPGDVDGGWLATPIMDDDRIVAALGVYTRNARCSDGESAATALKKAAAALTTSLHRDRPSAA
ncbi:helix-turn-helix domain-containing protein [Microbacterium sp. DT81.1]|uniref:helix-turn-helix domain-containing protein n=1 Tax=Microbacterium sp. DT81.1 TaxID=3393413 RepID=UPI003CF8B7BD